jgi:8-oxo-dGTP diphosphatase
MPEFPLPSLFLITNAAKNGIDAELLRIDGALAAGMRLLLAREPALADAELERFALSAAERCRRAGAMLLVSERGDGRGLSLARKIGAEGANLTAAALRLWPRRPGLAFACASCHNAEELALAAQAGMDCALLGHVLPTPSHPGEPPLGWTRFAELAKACPIPVYALGGQSAKTLAAALAHGACGVAGIRLGGLGMGSGEGFAPQGKAAFP